MHVSFVFFTAALITAWLSPTQAIGPVIVRGNKMYDTSTGNRFFIQGITYDYDVSDDTYDTNGKPAITANLKGLEGSFNTFRLYNVNPDKTYDKFMTHMQQLGVFVLVSASPANEDYYGDYRYSTITKDLRPDGTSKGGATCYPALLLNYGKKVRLRSISMMCPLCFTFT